MAAYEIEKQCTCVVSFDLARGGVTVTPPPETAAADKKEPKTFFFDAAYDWNSKQASLYAETVSPIVEGVLSGFNGTIFAYGQTGSGKTFTMEGKPDPPELQGVIPNSFEHIFRKIATDESDTTYLVRASYLEIYNEEVRDLLGEDPHKKLDLKQRTLPNGDEEVYVKDLTSFLVKEPKELSKIMEVGHSNRSVGRTDMNATSSRSHAIFTITIEASTTATASTGASETHIRAGKLNLVDLAGSERQSKTKAEGIRLKEGAKINLSLVALGNVICALVDGNSSHVPYRDSKLTRLLQSSLGGSCKTVMIANISPASYNIDETIGTLRYADRAKNIKNTPKVNEDPKDALLREYQEEIKRLRELIDARRNGLPPPPSALSSAPSIAASPEPVVEGVSQELLEQLRKQKGDEVAAILAEKGYCEEEITRIQSQLKEIEERTKKERRERAALEKKLKMMEDKLVGGTTGLFDENQKKRAVLEQQKLELERKRAEEGRLARQLEEERLKQEAFGKEVSDKKREAQMLAAKAKETYAKYRASKQELTDLQETIQQEREDLLDQIRELTGDLKLRKLIAKCFIPKEEAERSEGRLVWDDEKEAWYVRPMDSDDLKLEDLVASVGIAAAVPSPSSVDRNSPADMSQMKLDMPEKPTTTYRPEVDEISMKIKAALEESDEDDDEVVLHASENLPTVFVSEPMSFDDRVKKQMTPRGNQQPKQPVPRKPRPGVIAMTGFLHTPVAQRPQQQPQQQQQNTMASVSQRLGALRERSSSEPLQGMQPLRQKLAPIGGGGAVSSIQSPDNVPGQGLMGSLSSSLRMPARKATLFKL